MNNRWEDELLEQERERLASQLPDFAMDGFVWRLLLRVLFSVSLIIGFAGFFVFFKHLDYGQRAVDKIMDGRPYDEFAYLTVMAPFLIPALLMMIGAATFLLALGPWNTHWSNGYKFLASLGFLLMSIGSPLTKHNGGSEFEIRQAVQTAIDVQPPNGINQGAPR